MKKRLFSLFLIISMLGTFLVPSAFAAGETLTFATSASAGVKANDTFTVTVDSKEITGAYSGDIKISFDNTVFEVTNLAWNTTIPASLASTVDEANSNGFFSKGFVDNVNFEVISIPENTNFITATLRVKEGAANGASTITLTHLFTDEYSTALSGITANATSISVTVYSEISSPQAITVTAPAKGATPQSSIADGTGYTGAISWQGSPATFGANTVYAADITLTAKTGYKFVDGASITVAGATSVSAPTIAPDGSTLAATATFPATAAKAVSSIAVTGTPTKTAYNHGDTFEKAGITVTATYDDATTDDVTDAATVTYASSAEYLTKGDTSVTVNFGGKTATVTGLTVSTKELEITGLNATNRAYDGTNNVALTGGTLTGKVGTDEVTVTIPTSGMVSSADAGTGKAVTVATPSLSGANAANYTLKTITGITVTISQADPDVGAVSYSGSTIYPATAFATIESSLSKTGTTAGTLTLKAGQTLTAGTENYIYVFTPTDTTNYNTVEGNVSLTVTVDTLTGISVKINPTTTTYKHGDTFDKTGLVVTATYASATTADVTAAELTAPTTPLTMGMTSVAVSYQGQSCDVHITVSKAAAPSIAAQAIGWKMTVTGDKTWDFPAGLPADKGTTTYAISSIVNTAGVLTADPTVDANTGVVSYNLYGTASAGNTATFTVTATMENYENAAVNYTITLSDKDVPVISANDITVTHTGTPVDASAITGTATFDSAAVPGTWSFVGTPDLTNANSGLSVAVQFAPDDTAMYDTAQATIIVTINKATPTGTPTYTAITTTGKTLADAAIDVGSITPAGGSIAWDLGDSQSVTANTAYAWTYTPTDPANYNNLTGSITPYRVSTGGGGGSSTPSYAITASTAQHGSVSLSKTSANSGDTITITIKPDKGYTLETLTVIDKNGKEIELTENADGTRSFKMPASKVEVKATFMDDNTMLNFFVDVPADAYYYDAVLWAVKEGITSGTSATTFSPNDPCTRAQVVTFLWRAAGCPEPENAASFSDVGADTYYTKAVAWAAEQGITGGTGPDTFSPNATCTRGQIAAFLYRFVGSPAVSGEDSFGDVAADSYYTDAVKWAKEAGVTVGNGDGTFGPGSDCTRAQIVCFLYRYFVK